MAGLFLVLEGIDGAGKSSQLAMLADYMRRNGSKVRTQHFPRMEERPYGPMVAAFLRGDYGRDVDPHLAALLYALDRQRAAPEIREWLQGGGVYIADRYVHSNICYQCAKLPTAEARQKMAIWIEDLEYRHHGIPRPDLALFLDAPLAFTLANLRGKREGEDRKYLAGGEDIHEADNSLQERVRREFLDYAEKSRSELSVVDCSDGDGGMADARIVHSRIIDKLRYYNLVTR